MIMDAKLEIKIEKRKRIDKESALKLLNDHIRDIFSAYNKAVDKFNAEINQTIPEARTRLWAVLLNAKLTESFIRQFPENWTKGKYGRVIFRWEEVQLLIKKLNKNSKPSYIPTLLSDSIINQEQQSLFDEDEASKAEPILIFGYTKDSLGQIINPRIVYFNGKVEWVIDQEEFALRYAGKVSTEEINVSLKQKEQGEKKAE